MDEIVNRVTSSGLITIDVEEWVAGSSITTIDLKDVLWQGLILREKDLKEWLAALDYEAFKGQILAINCSVDVILPKWIYLLLISKFTPFAKRVIWGDINDANNQLILDYINNLDANIYADQRLVIKGCSTIDLQPAVYQAIIERFQPIAKSIMYGEACSTVPIYKKPKQA